MGRPRFFRLLADPRVWLAVVLAGVFVGVLMQRLDSRSRQLIADVDQRLKMKIAELKPKTIGEAFAKIERATGLKFDIDWQAFHAAGLESRSECFARLRDVKAFKALNALTIDVPFAWRVDSEGRVAITSIAADATAASTKHYAGLELLFPGREHPRDKRKHDLEWFCNLAVDFEPDDKPGATPPAREFLPGDRLHATPMLHDRVRRLLAEAADDPGVSTGWFRLRTEHTP